MEEAPPKRPHDHDIRCICGQLIARWARDGVEIKCKRCRRVIVIPFKSITGSTSSEIP